MAGRKYVLISDLLFFGDTTPVFQKGYMLVDGGSIVEMGSGEPASDMTGAVETVNLGARPVIPGMFDNTTFLPGFAAQHVGADLSACRTLDDCIELLKAQGAYPEGGFYYGHDFPLFDMTPECQTSALNRAFDGIPAVMMAHSRYRCALNQAAEQRFGFTHSSCFSEAYWQLLKALLGADAVLHEVYRKFSDYMLSRGVTALRDIGYDSLWGLPDRILKAGCQSAVRIPTVLISQPNGNPPDWESLNALQEKYCADDFKFTGIKLMVDDMTAFGASDTYLHPKDQSAYRQIEQWTLEADRRGLRVSLHADGDRAVHWAAGLLCRCANHETLRHSIISASLVKEEDLRRMRDHGIVLELYPTLLRSRHEDIVPQPFLQRDIIQGYVTAPRREDYMNYRRCFSSGVHVCFGSDFPYMQPDMEETIRACVECDSGHGVINPDHAIGIGEAVNAWTAAGYSANGCRGGKLEAGAPATFTVFDRDFLSQDIAGLAAVATVVDGSVAYGNL